VGPHAPTRFMDSNDTASSMTQLARSGDHHHPRVSLGSPVLPQGRRSAVIQTSRGWRHAPHDAAPLSR
jgi:hypothetical protein